MSDLEFFLLILAVFYVWECLLWIRRPGLVFRTFLGFRWEPVSPSGAFSNDLGGFLLAMPVPPLGTVHGVWWPPLIFDGHSVRLSSNPLDLPEHGTPRPSTPCTWKDLAALKTHRHWILRNGQKWMAAPSNSSARGLVRFLKSAVSANETERRHLVQTWMEERFDTKGVERLLSDFRNRSRWLRLLCQLHFMQLLIGLPVIGLAFSFREHWPWVLGSVVLLNTAISLLFWRHHAGLYPDDGDGRFHLGAIMFLYPLAAVRAIDALGRPLLENFHPMAVAAEVLQPPEFRSFARRLFRRAHFLEQKAQSHSATGNPDILYYQAMKRNMAVLLTRKSIDPETLLSAPQPNDRSCRSYCPRCESQFTIAAGTPCPECNVMQLEPFSETRELKN